MSFFDTVQNFTSFKSQYSFNLRCNLIISTLNADISNWNIGYVIEN